MGRDARLLDDDGGREDVTVSLLEVALEKVADKDGAEENDMLIVELLENNDEEVEESEEAVEEVEELVSVDDVPKRELNPC